MTQTPSKTFTKCPCCDETIRVTKDGKLASHKNGPWASQKCPGSGKKA